MSVPVRFALLCAVVGLAALLSGFVPYNLDNADGWPKPTTVSCGPAWLPDYTDVPDRLVPACAGAVAARSTFATGLLLASVMIGLTGGVLTALGAQREKLEA